MRDYHRYEFWQRAHAQAIRRHRVAKTFRGAEYASLRSQLTRSSDGVPATIVEGCGAATNAEFARYLDMSIKSASETEYHLLIARDREVLAHAVWQRLTNETVEIRRMIYGYRKKLLGGGDH